MKGFNKLSALALLFFVTLFSAGCSSSDTMPPEATETVVVAEVPDFETCVSIATETIEEGIVYFAYNQYDIAEEYKTILRQKAELLIKYPNINVRIAGNCDERGTQEYNLALGERRARAAYEYLVRLGVNPNQLEIISYGKERPAALGNNEQAWALNRRDEFTVTAR